MWRKMFNATLLFSILMYEASKAVPDDGSITPVPTAMRSYGLEVDDYSRRGGRGGGTKCKDAGKWCYNFGQWCSLPDMKKKCPKTCNMCPSANKATALGGVEKQDKVEVVTTNFQGLCSDHDCEHNCEVINNQKTCTCKTGYILNEEDGRSCQDIDECEEDQGSCATNFDAPYCKNIPGSFECVKDPPPCGAHTQNYYKSDKCCKISDVQQCGLNRVNTGGFGTPGLDSVLDQWPWSALVMIGKRPCTGTLISEEHVLVPAHCFSGWRDDVTVKVYLGMRSSDQNSYKHYTQTIKVSSNNINIHKKYNYPNNDIAVVQMDKAAKLSSYVRPICLPNGETPSIGGQCYISGYQSEVQGYSAKLILEETSLTVTDIDLCKKKNPAYASKMKGDDFICGSYTDDRTVCPGERGGALVCQRCSSCGWYIAGMASLGDACSDVTNGKLIFTTIEKYESWIAKITGINVNKDKMCTKIDNAPNRIVRGNNTWASWEEWSLCSVTCGGGSRKRERKCNGTCPLTGQGAQVQPCNTNQCPIWTDYTAWSVCSKSCGGGVKSRIRNCMFGEVGQEGCRGPTMEKEKCNEESCPYWLDWSEWSECSATCGKNVARYRSRECSDGDSDSCAGRSRQKENCDLPTCFKWGPWAEWTDCSKSCNGGTRTTSRVCLTQDTAPCKGMTEMTKSCNAFSCLDYAGDEAESECAQKKNVFGDAWCEDNQSAGDWCRKYKKWMRTNCAQTCCYVMNQETEKPETKSKGPKWSEWSECSVTCGSNGVQTRKKICNRNTNRAICKKTQERDCTSDIECPSTWSPWSAWSTCSASCGNGITVRSRECPEDGNCVGDSDEKKSCFTDYCPSLYSNWSSWSECSQSCGGGEKTRKRSCLNSDNAACKKDTREERKCNQKKCMLPKMPSFSPIVNTNSVVSNCNPDQLSDKYSTGYCRNRLDKCIDEDRSYIGKQVKRVCAKTCCQQMKALSECTDHPSWADECPLLQSYCFMFGMRDNKAHQGCRKTCQLC